MSVIESAAVRIAFPFGIPSNIFIETLLWHHNGRDDVSNHKPHDCLLNRLFRRRSKKTSKLRVTGLCEGNSPVTGEFPAKRSVTQKMFTFNDVILNMRSVFPTNMLASNRLDVGLFHPTRHVVYKKMIIHISITVTIFFSTEINVSGILTYLPVDMGHYTSGLTRIYVIPRQDLVQLKVRAICVTDDFGVYDLSKIINALIVSR